MLTLSILPRSQQTEAHGIRLVECEECQKKFEVDTDNPNWEDIRFCNGCYNDRWGEEGEADDKCICSKGMHNGNIIDCGCNCHKGEE